MKEFLSFGGERGCLGYAKQGYVGAPLVIPQTQLEIPMKHWWWNRLPSCYHTCIVYIYGPGKGCPISAPRSVFGSVKGPKFQTRGGFRYTHIYRTWPWSTITPNFRFGLLLWTLSASSRLKERSPSPKKLQVKVFSRWGIIKSPNLKYKHFGEGFPYSLTETPHIYIFMINIIYVSVYTCHVPISLPLFFHNRPQSVIFWATGPMNLERPTSWPGASACKGFTWRIIPVSKWLITMVRFSSPKWGYSPYKWPKWLINRGY